MSNWTYADELENQRRRKEWEKRKKHEKEEAERQRKQAALEAHLADRARRYFNHTGSMPTPSLMERWRDDYVAGEQRKVEAELQARRQKAIDEAYDF
jgi:carbonic anhydrase